jgi:hypothetical protein
MLAELVFVTRLLGLASGETEVVLRSSNDVQRVEILREGERLATLAAPPWRTKVQLGAELGPYELTAVGLDANGVEIARDSLLVNVALPEARAGIQLARVGEELTARLEWWHVDGFEPLMATLKLDGKIISRERTNRPVPLGKITDSSVHVVSVELRFPDGRQARREIAFGGVFSEEMPVELTAIGVRQRVAGSPSAEACFQLPGREERSAPVGVEHGTAIVLFVHNGDEPAWVRNDTANRRGVFALSGVELGVVSPRLQQNADASFFDSGRVPSELGTLVAIKARQRRLGLAYFADAVAATRGSGNAAHRVVRGTAARCVPRHREP